MNNANTTSTTGTTNTGNSTTGTSGTKSNSSSNNTVVPQAKEAMNKYKHEVANELGINLKQGYNGDLTSAQAGSIGGEMVRQMIQRQEQSMANGSTPTGL